MVALLESIGAKSGMQLRSLAPQQRSGRPAPSHNAGTGICVCVWSAMYLLVLSASYQWSCIQTLTCASPKCLATIERFLGSRNTCNIPSLSHELCTGVPLPGLDQQLQKLPRSHMTYYKLANTLAFPIQHN